jgi:hypothetical protein
MRRTQKMGTRTVAYEGGLIVLFRAIMDNALGAYLKARLSPNSSLSALPLHVVLLLDSLACGVMPGRH